MPLFAHAKKLFKSVFLLSLFLANLALANAQPIKVVVIANKATLNMEQLSIQLWDKVANQLHYNYIMALVPDEKAGLDLLLQHKADVLLGLSAQYQPMPGISYINSYLDDAVVMVTADRQLSTWEIIVPYLKVGFSSAFALIMLLTFGIGMLVWLVERKGNPDQFPTDFWKGAGSGFWFSLTTMTTLGYGDKVPRTLLGRVVTGIWMFTMFVAASSFTVLLTAELASAKLSQKNTIHSVEQLKGKLVAYGQYNAQTQRLAQSFTDRPVQFQDIKHVLDALEANKVTAALVTAITLHCYFKDHTEAPTFNTNYEINLGSYAFAVPQHSPLASDISQVLYFMQQHGQIKVLENTCGS